MRVGVGLPTTLNGVDGRLLRRWSEHAEELGFTSLGTIDRVVYDAWEPSVALAAAATVTSRPRLVSMITIGPLRSTALLAKEAASLDVLSGGRMVLGLGLGAREDDYEAAGIDHRGRGRVLTEQLVRLRELWEGYEVGPRPVQSAGPRLLVGGLGGAAYARMAHHADGFVHNGGPPRAFAAAVARARAAWTDAGRPGRPQLWGQAYWALGDESTVELGRDYLRYYYRFTGAFADQIAAGCLVTPSAARDHVRSYEEEGCDELVVFPTVAELDQLDRLADALGDYVKP